MIYHRGASLSEQHTDLPIGHCTKQDLSRTSRYADKSSPEIARYHSKLLYKINQCIIELIFHKLPLEESVLD